MCFGVSVDMYLGMEVSSMIKKIIVIGQNSINRLSLIKSINLVFNML